MDQHYDGLGLFTPFITQQHPSSDTTWYVFTLLLSAYANALL